MEIKVGGIKNPWRRTYEAYGVIAWFVVLVFSSVILVRRNIPLEPFIVMFIGSGIMLIVRSRETFWVLKRKVALKGKALDTISTHDLIKRMKKEDRMFWVGTGFEWENKHSQNVYDLKKLEIGSIMPPKWVQKFISRIYKYNDKPNYIGKPWIHGLETEVKDLYLPEDHLSGHMLVLATTRWGKTRLFEMLSTQIIHKRDRRCLIVLDPKGDFDLMNAIKKECENAGRPDDFIYFHPAHPKESVRINPLQNFNRATELASRIASLIPAENGSDSFSDFAWRHLNVIANGLIMIEESPNIIKLKRYIQGGPDQLLQKALKVFLDRNIPDWEEAADKYIKAAGLNKRGRPSSETSDELVGMVNFYKKEVLGQVNIASTQVIDGLINIYDHDRTHSMKMLAVLAPTLEQLTSGALEQLLSPNPDDIEDDRPIVDTRKIIDAGKIFYCGLDSLSDNRVGRAIGSILLADITSCAGDRQNYALTNEPVHILVDEASEAMSPPFVALLNKGGSSGFRVLVATQTVPDLIAETGNEAMALKILGNINNVITGRIQDKMTMEYATEKFGTATILTRMHTQSTSAMQGDKDPTNFTGGYGERLIPVDDHDLIPPELLGDLPNFEYIGSLSGGRIIKGIIPLINHDIK
jgi:conjugal transfer pilus assembly protein TraD